jgi:hypothetical protein
MSGIQRRNVNLLTTVRRDLGYRERNHFSFAREVVPKQTPDIIKNRNALFIGGTSCIRCPQNGCPFQLRHLTERSKSAPWTMMESSTRSSSRVAKMLVFPCRKDGVQWVDASNKKPVDIQPTHWRKWTESD